jgi:hypothetical protein
MATRNTSGPRDASASSEGSTTIIRIRFRPKFSKLSLPKGRERGTNSAKFPVNRSCSVFNNRMIPVRLSIEFPPREGLYQATEGFGRASFRAPQVIPSLHDGQGFLTVRTKSATVNKSSSYMRPPTFRPVAICRRSGGKRSSAELYEGAKYRIAMLFRGYIPVIS